MPNAATQQFLAVFEILLVLAGAYLIVRLVRQPAPQARWLRSSQFPPWPVTAVEFCLFLLLIFVSGLLLQAVVRIAFGHSIAAAPDRGGLEVFAYGFGFHGGGLLGWLLFPLLRRFLYRNYGTVPAAAPQPSGLAWNKIPALAGGTLLVALPIVILLNFGWTALLRRLGLPDEPQDLIAIFAGTKSPVVIAGMLFVACVLAPLNEELIFRAGLYRFTRQRLGRGWALVITGSLFGALHGNLAGIVPLGVLGALLAVAYEATGDIRVSIVAHGLFNLNTILIILSGLSD